MYDDVSSPFYNNFVVVGGWIFSLRKQVSLGKVESISLMSFEV